AGSDESRASAHLAGEQKNRRAGHPLDRGSALVVRQGRGVLAPAGIRSGSHRCADCAATVGGDTDRSRLHSTGRPAARLLPGRAGRPRRALTSNHMSSKIPMPISRYLPPTIGGVALLVVWESLPRLFDISTLLLPPPSAVAASMWHLFDRGLLVGNFLVTLVE